MKTNTIAAVAAITLLVALALPDQLAAQQTRYKIIDLGTFGGPNSGQLSPGRSVNGQGIAIPSGADLATPDPYAPNCLGDCFLLHAARWQNGVLTDLGSLPGVNDSLSLWISDTDVVAGLSENGLIDPLTGFPQVQAVLWDRGGKLIPLGGLGGNSGQAFSVNSHGQVVGVALNTIPDPFAQVMNFLPAATQARAFLWQNGLIQDIGTLGGNDAQSSAVNENGQIVGFSFTDSTPNPTTGIPTVHPFVWKDGNMLDLGTLGGTFVVPGSIFSPGGCCINSRGQVVGTSTLPGDATWHPFLWEKGVISDLSTLGGDNGEAFFINEAGAVVGRADLPGSVTHHAFLWKNGTMTDLGILPGETCSTALGVNSRGQVVGETGICGVPGDGPAFISEGGGPMVDLNSLVLPGSDLSIVGAAFINDRGEIAGAAVLANGDTHAILLIPASAGDIAAANALAQSHPAAATTSKPTFRPLLRGRQSKPFPRFGRGAGEP